MAISFNLPIYFEDIKEEQRFMSPLSMSGSLFNTGLHLTDDTTDPSGSTLNTLATLVDEHYSTVAVSGSASSGSIGIDLGKARAVSKLTLYDDGTAGAGITWSGSSDSLQGFRSADNSSWHWFEDFYVERELYSGSAYQIECPFSTTQTYRYFKLYADSGYLKSAVGNYLGFTEIKAWIQPDAVEVSGSIYHDNIVDVGDIITPALN